MVYPLAIGGACIITSIIGTWFVKLGKSKNIMGALYKGFIVTAVTSLLIMYPVTNAIIGITNTYNNNAGAIFSGLDLYICGIVGFVITGLLIWVTEYYTGTNYRPVKSVAQIINNWTWNKCNSRFSHFNGGHCYSSVNNSSRYFIH